MRPTFSIIFFTVLSGAGYGVLFLAGLSFLQTDSLLVGAGEAAALVRAQRACEVALVVGAALAATGLVFSVGHLGKPLRAWRAFSQWRSSWLSREGVLAVLTFVPVIALLWSLLSGGDVRAPVAKGLGVALACLCVATVFCTARIYSSLKPVRAWHNGYVLPSYLLLAFYAGALWMAPIQFEYRIFSPLASWAWIALAVNALVVAPLCAGLKFAYWRWLDADRATPNAGDATGLARLGNVRSFEQPHTQENYLTHEMGFVLARKHARRLRAIALVLILFAPLLTFAPAFAIGYASTWVGLVLGMLGIFVERWLFFAEARHAVIAYYGR
jgi:DMSO reductase anchor subunit